jgi:hypothetical protein
LYLNPEKDGIVIEDLENCQWENDDDGAEDENLNQGNTLTGQDSTSSVSVFLNFSRSSDSGDSNARGGGGVCGGGRIKGKNNQDRNITINRNNNTTRFYYTRSHSKQQSESVKTKKRSNGKQKLPNDLDNDNEKENISSNLLNREKKFPSLTALANAKSKPRKIKNYNYLPSKIPCIRSPRKPLLKLGWRKWKPLTSPDPLKIFQAVI